jgi:hypothetical protein
MKALFFALGLSLVTPTWAFAQLSTPSRATATISSVSASATVVTLLAANARRRGFALYNDSTSAVYVKFGSAASSTSFTIKMVPSSYFEGELPVYSGIITAIWVSATGAMRTSEL